MPPHSVRPAFTSVGTLVILHALDRLGASTLSKLASWLSERQLSNGGLNGRPEKLEDVCYSWWILTALSMIGKLHWIDGKKLSSFILSCQVSGRPSLSAFIVLTPKLCRRKPLLRILTPEASRIDQTTSATYTTPSLAALVSLYLASPAYSPSTRFMQCRWTSSVDLASRGRTSRRETRTRVSHPLHDTSYHIHRQQCRIVYS